MNFLVSISLLLAGLCHAKIYFKDTFDSDIKDRWVVSDWKQSEGQAGEWEWTSGKWPTDSNNKGLRTSQDARFYSISVKTDEVFDNEGKDLVFQFSVKHEQKIDCGGGYVKLLPPTTDQKSFNGEAEYSVMFGPDICGYSTKKVHAILNHKGTNLEKKEEVKIEDDEFTHVYTLILHADDTYEIQVDGEKKSDGSIKDAWDFEKPKTIKDPAAKKPSDWVDDEYIDDAEDKKPEDWDSAPEMITDPEAKKPEDWDDEEDGEWEAPQIKNPEWKGEWKPKRIKNPEYKGAWVHPEIDNPDYVQEQNVYKRGKIGVIGIEIWQVKSGTIFDNIILTDDVKEAQAFSKETKIVKADEEAAKKAFDEANKPPEPEPEPEKSDDTDQTDDDAKEDMEELDDADQKDDL